MWFRLTQYWFIQTMTVAIAMVNIFEFFCVFRNRSVRVIRRHNMRMLDGLVNAIKLVFETIGFSFSIIIRSVVAMFRVWYLQMNIFVVSMLSSRNIPICNTLIVLKLSVIKV